MFTAMSNKKTAMSNKKTAIILSNISAYNIHLSVPARNRNIRKINNKIVGHIAKEGLDMLHLCTQLYTSQNNEPVKVFETAKDMH